MLLSERFLRTFLELMSTRTARINNADAIYSLVEVNIFSNHIMATPNLEDDNPKQVENSNDNGRAKLRSWLGKVFKIVITDGRQVVGQFVCTDRDGNLILENTLEYGQIIGGNNEPRNLGVALIPGRHIQSVSLMT